MAVTRETAVEIVRAEAVRRGHSWREPVRAIRKSRFVLFGRRYWSVWSNTGARGCNVRAHVDEETGKITLLAWLPR